VGIFLLLSSSTNAENNQSGNNGTQHTVTDARTAITGCAKRAKFLKPNEVEPIRIRSTRKYFRKAVERIRVTGTCCLKIYEKFRHRGASQVLHVGHNGEHELRNIRSFVFDECSSFVEE